MILEKVGMKKVRLNKYSLVKKRVANMVRIGAIKAVRKEQRIGSERVFILVSLMATKVR